MIKLSIITVATDRSVYIDEAISSPPPADPSMLEHIIVYDGNAAFIEALAARYPRIAIVDGNKKGSTDAVNKGIASATGDYLIFLHSDDWLKIDDLSAFLAVAAARPDVLIWTGTTRIFDDYPDSRGQGVAEITAAAAAGLSIEEMLNGIPLWNGRLYHRSLFERVGVLDTNFSESADREFMVRILLAGITSYPIAGFDYYYRAHAGSQTINNEGGRASFYIREHLRLAELLCRRPSTPASVVAVLHRWSQAETIRLIYHEMKAGRWGVALSLLAGRTPRVSIGCAGLLAALRAMAKRRALYRLRDMPHFSSQSKMG
jgi:glycosyltransferase involved in cell wall biosynthesis